MADEDIADMVLGNKVKDHESSYQAGLWNRRVVIYTGVAGFSPEIDALIEGATMDGLEARKAC